MDVLLLSSFGVDVAGRVYATSLAGPVYRLEAARCTADLRAATAARPGLRSTSGFTRSSLSIRFALGLWTFSLAPLVGGNLFIAVALAGVVVVLGAVVFGSLAARWPVDRRRLRLADAASSARASAQLSPSRHGGSSSRCSPRSTGTSIARPGHRSAADLRGLGRPCLLVSRTRRHLHVVADRDRGGDRVRRAGHAASGDRAAGHRRRQESWRSLPFSLSSSPVAPNEFRDAFDERSAEVYGTSPLASSQIVEIGGFDASVTKVEPLDTLRPRPARACSSASGSDGPARWSGEVRVRKPDAIRRALIRVAAISTL